MPTFKTIRFVLTFPICLPIILVGAVGLWVGLFLIDLAYVISGKTLPTIYFGPRKINKIVRRGVDKT